MGAFDGITYDRLHLFVFGQKGPSSWKQQEIRRIFRVGAVAYWIRGIGRHACRILCRKLSIIGIPQP